MRLMRCLVSLIAGSLLAGCDHAIPTASARVASDPDATTSFRRSAPLKVRLGQTLPELPKPLRDLALSSMKPDGEFYLPLHGDFTFDVETFPYLRGRRFRFVDVSGRKVNDVVVVRHLAGWSAQDHLDDWDSAIAEAESIVADVRRAQPGVVSVREHPEALSDQQFRKSNRLLMSPFSPAKVDALHTASQARALFDRLHAAGDEDQRRLRQSTYVAIESLIAERTIWRVSISKDFYYGNWESLQPPLRDVLRYEVDVLIAARED